MFIETVNKHKQNYVYNKDEFQFKLLYMFGIIFVTATHCKLGGVSLFYDWFSPNAFQLGLFMFCSGYFYKSEVENEPLTYIKKKFKRLIIPLYLWNFFYAIFVLLLSYEGFKIGGPITFDNLFIKPITSGHQFSYNMGAWYIIPLFMILTINCLLRKALSYFFSSVYKDVIALSLYVVLGLLGVHYSSIGLNKGWYLVLMRMLYFMPFFAGGYFYKNTLKKFDKFSSNLYFSVVMCLTLCTILYCGRLPWYTPSWCNDFKDGVLMPYVSGFLGIAFWLRLTYEITPLFTNKAIINLIANNTYSIMMHQFLGFMFVKSIFALISKYTVYFQNFDWLAYKTTNFYLYLPLKINQFKIIYLVAGIFIPILIAFVCETVWKHLKVHF